MGNQPIARQLPTYRTTQSQNKRTQTSMRLVGLKPTTPVFERAKTVHALERAAARLASERAKTVYAIDRASTVTGRIARAT
jgi:hypothetical protein